jgi:hypothetical protein
MLGWLFFIFQLIVGAIVGIILLIALYVLIFDWDKYR